MADAYRGSGAPLPCISSGVYLYVGPLVSKTDGKTPLSIPFVAAEYIKTSVNNGALSAYPINSSGPMNGRYRIRLEAADLFHGIQYLPGVMTVSVNHPDALPWSKDFMISNGPGAGNIIFPFSDFGNSSNGAPISNPILIDNSTYYPATINSHAITTEPGFPSPSHEFWSSILTMSFPNGMVIPARSTLSVLASIDFSSYQHNCSYMFRVALSCTHNGAPLQCVGNVVVNLMYA